LFQTALTLFYRRFESAFEYLFTATGGMALLLAEILRNIRHVSADRRRILRQMLEVGWNTLPLASMIGFFTGMITSLQTGMELKTLGLHHQIGSIVGISLAREMGPVFAALIVAARVGAAWTAEIGTMSVSEEVDALRSLGIRPVRFLGLPRFVASIIMLPILTVYAIMVGIWGGAMVSANYLGVPSRIYYRRMWDSLELADIRLCLLKAFFFGVIISIVSTWCGLATTNGAEGVGRSTTRSVVITLSLILVADYFITRFIG